MRWSQKAGRHVVIGATLFCATVLGIVLLPGAISAQSQPNSALNFPPVTRSEAIARAKSWVDNHVPYSQTHVWTDGYREDCSGLVSMAWGLATPGITTQEVLKYATPISKDDLLAGDALLNTATHIVLFAGWANKNKTAYNGYEESDGYSGFKGARLTMSIPYPYWTGTPPENLHPENYHPVRYKGMQADNSTNPPPTVTLTPGRSTNTNPSSGTTPGITRISNGHLEWDVRNTNSGGVADVTFVYGVALTDKPIVGDWDGNGTFTPGVVRPDGTGHWKWLLRNSNTSGSANISFVYGLDTDMPIVGDWDGNGTFTPGVVRRDGTGHWKWLLHNSLTGGSAEISFVYGLDTDIPIVGDWNGNGKTTIGVVRRNGTHWNWYLHNSNSGGSADISFTYGLSTDTPIVGDWDGNHSTTPGVIRPDGTHLHWYLRNTNTSGDANQDFLYGLLASDTAIAGNWDGK